MLDINKNLIIGLLLLSFSATAQKIVYSAKPIEKTTYFSTKKAHALSYSDKTEHSGTIVYFGPSDVFEVEPFPQEGVRVYYIYDLKKSREYTYYPGTKYYRVSGGGAPLPKVNVKESGDTVVMGYQCKKYTVETESVVSFGNTLRYTYHYYVTTELAYPRALIKRESNYDHITVGEIKGFLLKLDYHSTYYYPKKDTYYDVTTDHSMYLKDFGFEPAPDDRFVLPVNAKLMAK